MNPQSYLARIGYQGPTAANLENLKAIHLAHLYAVPFENLSIHAEEPIVLDTSRLFDKVIGRGRGGFCYELNGLFAALLNALGYRVTLLSARVSRQEGGFGPDFDHLCLRVDLPEGPHLVDVGFGENFREPLRLDHDRPQEDHGKEYRLVSDGDALILEHLAADAWQPSYRFTLRAHDLDDFAAMCVYHQTSPKSSFTRRITCSLAFPGGRKTLAADRFILTNATDRQEIPVTDRATWGALLERHFAMEMPARLDPLSLK